MAFRAFAPGRVEILGNHTDYNGGVVLSAALDVGITAAGALRSDGVIRLRSSEVEEVTVQLPSLHPAGSWSDYPLGVVKLLREAGAAIPGLDAEFSSTLPVGSGLSSSAALEVATAVLMMELTGFSLSALDTAKLCRRAENEFVGVNCGLLDQVSSIFGAAGQVIFLDCRDETISTIPFPDEAALVVINSGVKHALTGGEYNERRENCFQAARLMRVPALRDVTPDQLSKARLPDRVHRRAMHVVGENARVFQAREALLNGNMEALGNLMTESHHSSCVNFENSAPELDLLVETARAIPGVWGARLTGGGFGGSIVALVTHNQAERAAMEIVRVYNASSHHHGSALVCRPGDGAWIANKRKKTFDPCQK